jgi:hypothetical protein
VSAQHPDPLFVRIGVRYIRSRHGKLPPNQDTDGVHVLNAEERAALKRISRAMIIRAACAGATSTCFTAAVEVAANPLQASGHVAGYYFLLLSSLALASMLEIMFLYWDALRSVHELSRAAGLPLFSEEDAKSKLAATMARAALEIPNPRLELEGIDPWKEASRFRLLVASLVYKAKVSATNFVFKAIVRRALSRAAVRTYLVPFVAVPFTAMWNAIVAWLIVREAKLRVMGPSAAHALIEMTFGKRPELSTGAAEAALRAVGASIVKKEDLHPNLFALFREVSARVPHAKAAESLDDTKAFLARLATIDAKESEVVLRVLAIATILDGRITKKERALLADAFKATGRNVDLSRVEALRVAFTSGDEMDASLVENIVVAGADESVGGVEAV